MGEEAFATFGRPGAFAIPAFIAASGDLSRFELDAAACPAALASAAFSPELSAAGKAALVGELPILASEIPSFDGRATTGKFASASCSLELGGANPVPATTAGKSRCRLAPGGDSDLGERSAATGLDGAGDGRRPEL
eukprot:gnl/TRDRNA2_/TRDRNA2_90433_c2_seq1.p2 gnl/TRDRNA2_/TRDRNA2_90433_c2~~gnl/TRDRNA2_/TRDRNA2_90433_c2_seq1.p2  ORF type:complete len:137 (-),score=19.23 gnl/TRDRNA2_/TRDRNA2_90433_c2_seq1:72-482(-)